MGLDMYLIKKTYVKNWDHMNPEQLHEITVRRNNSPVTQIKPERITHIIEEMCYWRKANAIHDWFVQNCQNGEDDCREYYVYYEQLEKLVAIIAEILNAPAGEARDYLAKLNLPPSQGFFFGSDEIDDWYYTELERTMKELTNILAEDQVGHFYYHSSW
jgi:hypothetical protein